MKPLALLGGASAALALAVAGGYWLGARSPVPTLAPAPSAQKAERKILFYRNPMGLVDTSPTPKKDPMGMDYVPVYEGDAQAEAAPSGSVKISPDKMQVLGVRTEPAEARELRRAVRAVGTIQPNERLLYKLTPRFEGWIEKLYVNTTGQAVARGQPLLEAHSPDLVTAQDEYLIALRAIEQTRSSGPEAQAVMQRLAAGALERLRHFGISEPEIEALRRERKTRDALVIRSPAAGVVLAKPSVQGMRFMPGDTLYEVADLSTVWMVADVFERDLGLVRPGQQAELRIVAYPDKVFSGKVVFIQPALDPDTRTARVRVELANPGGLLKVAMYGDAQFVADRAARVLAVPESAVLDSGERQIVLVQRGEGLFEPREVKLGQRADGYAEVKEGLSEGQQVVVRANFLIDAESNLKAALESFSSPGSKPAVSQTHKAHGTVVAIDTSAGRVQIEHGAIATLQWPAMTMEFAVRDKALLSGLKPGESVDFELAAGPSGEYVVQKIKGL